ncbi:MAG: hypothetical protein E7262_06835 [Lachnospiraceae bacterium]|nr:hypothetical protein [Lachnospiraceae bacterium]
MFNKRYDKRFDFNRDGELSRRERNIRRKIFEEVKRVENKQREEQELREKYRWRDFCEDGSDYDIDPEDYEDESDYEEALEEAKYAWREHCEDGSRYYISPHYYETEIEYYKALKEAKKERYGWRENCEDGSEYDIDPEDYEGEYEYNEALEEAKKERYGWRENCEDGSEYDIYPEDYETEDEYYEALEEAEEEKYSWREYCEDGSDIGIYPEYYETEEEYEDALYEARQEEEEKLFYFVEKVKKTDDKDATNDDDEINEKEYVDDSDIGVSVEEENHNSFDKTSQVKEIKEEDYANKRRYEAAKELEDIRNSYYSSEYKKEIMEKCNFILEQADNVIAANYFTHNNGFLYSAAVRENIELDITLPGEETKPQYEAYEIIDKIARKDVSKAIDVWKWLVDNFIPYKQYDANVTKAVVYNILRRVVYKEDEIKEELVRRFNTDKKFMNTVVKFSEDSYWDLSGVVYKALEMEHYELAKLMYKSRLEIGNWREHIRFTEELIDQIDYDEGFAQGEYIYVELLPIAKEIGDDMVKEEAEKWEENMMDDLCDACPNDSVYAYLGKNSWRKNVPDGKKYGIHPLDYENEEDYLEDIEYEKNGWKKKYRSGAYAKIGINIDDFDREEEYLKELQRKRESYVNNKKQRENEYHENIKRQVEEKAINRKERFGRDDIYIFVGVVYEDSNRVYNYLTEDESIDIGDIVAVPVGYANEEKKAKVVSVGKYERIAAPYSPDKCKYVLRKIEM